MHKKGRKIKEVREDYEGFLERFKPRRTTDDCMTPPAVYQAVLDWVDANLMPLDGTEIIRPFWPGGDYENAEYPPGCVVIDNPPFSILSSIRRFFASRGIRYFLFAPGTTLGPAKGVTDTVVVCGIAVEYENGAKITTSFVTNIDADDSEILVAGSLAKTLRKAVTESRKSSALLKQSLPPNVTSSARLQKIARGGIDLRISRASCKRISALDCQRSAGTGVYGGCWLLSEKAAAEKAAAEMAAAKMAAERDAIVWELSEREKAIIATLE